MHVQVTFTGFPQGLNEQLKRALEKDYCSTEGEVPFVAEAPCCHIPLVGWDLKSRSQYLERTRFVLFFLCLPVIQKMVTLGSKEQRKKCKG